MAPFSFTLNDL